MNNVEGTSDPNGDVGIDCGKPHPFEKSPKRKKILGMAYLEKTYQVQQPHRVVTIVPVWSQTQESKTYKPGQRLPKRFRKI